VTAFAEGWGLYAESAPVGKAMGFYEDPYQRFGQLKILELRRRAEAALGDDFDIRAFHARVLEEGDLPLDILEARIDAWLAGESGTGRPAGTS